MKPLTSPRFMLLCCALLLMAQPLVAQVGIGNTNPRTQLDVDGALSLRTGPDLTLSNGNNNDVSLGTTPYSFYRITGPSSAFNISSIAAVSGNNTDGQIVTLENTTAQTLRIRNNAGGTATNRILCPGSQDLVLSGQYATVTLMYQTTHDRWVVIGHTQNPASSESVSLTGDVQISAATWTNVTGMSLTFTARKSSVMVMLTASGFAFTNSMALVQLRVRNGTATVGGTTTKMQSYDDLTGTVTAWSCAYTSALTGLTPGTSYTLTVQGQVAGILGTPNAAIFNTTYPDSHHMTLSVIH